MVIIPKKVPFSQVPMNAAFLSQRGFKFVKTSYSTARLNAINWTFAHDEMVTLLEEETVPPETPPFVPQSIQPTCPKARVSPQ